MLVFWRRVAAQDSNTCSPSHAGPPPDLATLAAAVDGLAARDLTGLAARIRAERILALRRRRTASKATG